MPYSRPYASGFVDYPSTTTPINSTALNTMDVGIKTANDQFQTVTTAQRTALTPTVGQCVWDSDLRQLMVYLNASGGNAWQPIGNRIICTSTTRPATPFHGQSIYETDTKKEYVYNGTLWVQEGSTLTTTSVTGVNNMIVRPACYVPLAATQAVANSTDTALAFGAATFNIDMTVTAGTVSSTFANAGKIAVSTTGIYSVGYSVNFAANVTAPRYAVLAVNGTGAASTGASGYGWQSQTPSAYPCVLTNRVILSLTAGDYVQLIVAQVSGGSLNASTITAGNFISLHLVGLTS